METNTEPGNVRSLLDRLERLRAESARELSLGTAHEIYDDYIYALKEAYPRLAAEIRRLQEMEAEYRMWQQTYQGRAQQLVQEAGVQLAQLEPLRAVARASEVINEKVVSGQWKIAETMNSSGPSPYVAFQKLREALSALPKEDAQG